MIVVTVNGKSVSSFVDTAKRPMSEEEHQRRIVRSVRRISTNSIRNHSNTRSSRGQVIFSAGGAQ